MIEYFLILDEGGFRTIVIQGVGIQHHLIIPWGFELFKIGKSFQSLIFD